MALFLSFIVLAVASMLQVQGTGGYDRFRSCLQSKRDENGLVKCLDYDSIIACLRDIISSVSSNPMFLWYYIESQITYFENRKMTTSCAGLENKGTCIEKELEKCTIAITTTDSPSCQNLELSLQCLTDLKGICDTNKDTDNLIQKLTRSLEKCLSNTGAGICLAKLDSCKLYELSASMNEERYEDACRKVGRVKACMDQIEATCNDYTLTWKHYLNDISLHCDSGTLTGKCSYISIRNCRDGLMRDLVRNPCVEAEVNAAKKCMSDMKPHCVSEQQRQHHKNGMEKIELMCPTA